MTSCARATFVGCAVLCGQSGGKSPHDYPLNLFRFPPAQSARPTTSSQAWVNDSDELQHPSLPTLVPILCFGLSGLPTAKGVTGKARLHLRRARAGTWGLNGSSQGISQDRSPVFVCGYPRVCVQGCVLEDCDVRVGACQPAAPVNPPFGCSCPASAQAGEHVMYFRGKDVAVQRGHI